MQIRLRFTLPVIDPTGTRDFFWRAYGRLALDDGALRDEPRYAASMEARLYSDFMPQLNQDVRNHFGIGRGDPIFRALVHKFADDLADPAPFQRLTLKIDRIDYNSLELWLEVLGLDSDTLLPIVAASLEVYAPQALAEAMRHPPMPMGVSASPVPPAASADTLPTSTVALPAQETKGSAARDAGQRILTIARDSVLLLPVALALTVAYIAFSAFSEQLKDGRQEHRAILQSSLDFAKIVTEHNAAMARVIQQSAADVTKSLKELQQLQLDELKARTANQNAPPVPIRVEPRRHCLLSLWCD